MNSTMQRDISGVNLRCLLKDEPRAKEILATWPALEALPADFWIEDEGTFRRLTVTNKTAGAYILLTGAQWKTTEPASVADHLAHVLGRYTNPAPRESRA